MAVAVILTVSSFGQQKKIWEWRDSSRVGVGVTDTVVYPPRSIVIPQSLGGCSFTLTVDAEFLNTNTTQIVVGGGGGKYVRTSDKILKFQPQAIDTIQPYTLDRSKIDFIQRSGGIVDTTWMRTFRGDFFGYDVPMLRIIKGSTTGTKYVSWVWRFYR